MQRSKTVDLEAEAAMRDLAERSAKCLRANHAALKKLSEAVKSSRGHDTSFRCGLCGAERTSADISARAFSHHNNCPALVLEAVEAESVEFETQRIEIEAELRAIRKQNS